MSNNDVPIWEKYTLTIEEASKYFRIGENKLRRLSEENPTAGWVILNGNRIQIKRKQFFKFFRLLVPRLVPYIIPAIRQRIMRLHIPLQICRSFLTTGIV